ncbi:DNA polymerase [Novimethylophilus kurashikiensis]|uniref:DNA polymerase n=1 Tax=Novimethylophilus kurashikiensis TaxID=1825523 RepID=UPI0015E818ED|nr:DNA polymerase [Novimethylophilus kurashikiensis]
MAAKAKHKPLALPDQLGFGFEVCDAQGNRPEFLSDKDEVYAALDLIGQAQWASVDVETTGLTDASSPVVIDMQNWKQGASSRVRMRTIQVRVPTVRGRKGPRIEFAFDCDKMGPALTQEVAQCILSRRIFIAHNAGFDLYWLRLAQGRTVMPAIVVDTMLMVRLLNPKLVLKRAELVSSIKHNTEIVTATEVEQAAWKSLITGASGGSLADVVLAMFGVVVDKSFQKPTNWTGLLSFGHYDYAIDDVVWADRILCELLGLDAEGDLYQAYLGQRARKATVRLVEPQVPELVLLREHGMPLNTSVGNKYVRTKRIELSMKVSELIALEPTLETYREALSDPDAGLDDDLKKCLAAAFEKRGVVLRRTAATGAPQVGEKDLRACRAIQIEESRPLFNAWVAVCRAKKTSNMALEVVGFAERSADGRVRALLSHGPVTGRLAASEPNVQQWPRDQLFRAMCMAYTKPGCEFMDVLVTVWNQPLIAKAADRDVSIGEVVRVESAWLAGLYATDKITVLATEENQAVLAAATGKTVKVGALVSTEFSSFAGAHKASAERKEFGAAIEAQFTHRIVASDFGALDVRVGAALCVRAQRDMLAAARGHVVPGGTQPPENVLAAITTIARLLGLPDAEAALKSEAARFKKEVTRLDERMENLKRQLDDGGIQRNKYYKLRGEVKDELLAARLGYRLAQCMSYAVARGETDYSALRDAFVADIDIHTFTGMKLAGRDPMKEFEGLTPSDRKNYEKKLKKELGPKRQQGKIANLSLLYGMADAGFQEAAARGYDEHWTLDEAGDIRDLWMDAYPEVELWHLWTECLQAGIVYLPDGTKEKPVRTGWWMARTLAEREIVAFGLNAALSYQDQSSGADILGMIMHRLNVEYPDIFDCAINQVHDEVVFCLDEDKFKAHLEIIEMVMVEEANKLTMPYGVPCAVSPATGVLWIKD